MASQHNPTSKAWLIVSILLTFSFILLADTLNVTWDGTNWNTTWTNGGGCTCDTSCLLDYQTTGGNPDHRRRSFCEGKNDTPTGHHEWPSTWETLGVTAGNVVSAIQMTDVDYQFTTDTNCDDVDIGPFELRNSSNTLVSTMWAGTGSLTTAGAYAAAGSQASQGVGALTASTSNIELWMQMILDTANVTGAICISSFDNLDITVTHALPGAPRPRVVVISDVLQPDPNPIWETRISLVNKYPPRTRRVWRP
jgi:hypothetical protein